MNFIEGFRNPEKEHDPDKVTAYHEAAHGLTQVSFGLLPKYTSLKGFNGATGFNSTAFYTGYDIGVNWKEEGPKFALMFRYAGVIGGAWYSGFYDWDGAAADMKEAANVRTEYSITYRQALAIWMDCHYLVEDNSDLLTKAAERLYRDKVLGTEYWEEVLLTKM